MKQETTRAAGGDGGAADGATPRTRQGGGGLFVVARAFQFRGTMWRAGQTLRLSDGEAADPFVAAHVKAADGEQRPAQPTDYLGNGEEKPKEDAPAKTANEAGDGMSAKEMRAALGRMGVPCPPNATKEDLAVLLAQAKEAVAGSGEEANRPKDEGR